MLTINLDVDNIGLVEQIDVTPQQIKQAYNRAVARTIDFISVRLAKELSLALDVPQRVLKVRMMKRTANGFGYLWIGLNPVNAEYVGVARQTKMGISVRKHKFDDAFIGRMSNGKIGVFRRKTEKPLPLENVKVDLFKEAGIEELFTRYQRQAESYFEKQFAHELTFIKSKAK
jgi:hypothetical protein